MPRTREHSEPTRKLYADIREDIYLAAKSRAAELSMPMRRFVEDALTNAISGNPTPLPESSDVAAAIPIEPSVWDDQYLSAQANQPLGAPIGLSEDEARRVALGAFNFSDNTGAPTDESDANQSQFQARGKLGDPVDLSDEDARCAALNAFNFNDSANALTGDLSPNQRGFQARGRVGDPLDLSDEDAAQLARAALMFGATDEREVNSG